MTRNLLVKFGTVLAVVASGAALMATPAEASAGKRLKLANYDLCLDVKDFNGKNAATVQLWKCNHNANQLWTMGGDGSIRSTLNGKCLDIKDFNGKNAAVMQMWKCSGNSNQQWYLGGSKYSKSGYRTIRSRMNNKCLDARVRLHTTERPHNGTPIQTWRCHGDYNQSFLWS
ncbi:RICIN domain-containing protein [Nonomuraea rhodomycinica]|uniref:Ricin-type beta-trefoil lectin domain protein n=1 Tax=Nonomuraea rhodomycinica TaxID=1712872 RepID=A0A7Y6ITK9_9ACTN|nr:RICIN domain-containing protein [Nonomuraea rhodomycinica]NUW43920.1 ricin-type beta-trefoil lectin domain protein [Nonomuraea rhodomycinica]